MKSGHAHASQIENIKKIDMSEAPTAFIILIPILKYRKEEEDKASKNPAVWQVRLKWLNRAAIDFWH